MSATSVSRYDGVPLNELVWAKIDRTAGCWLWLAGTDEHGYGRVTVNGVRALLAHRLVYFNLVGPTELGLDHLCRNRACVNPNHLEPVPQAVNVARGDSGRLERERVSCPKGHRYAGTNLKLRKGARRACRACANEANRQHRARKAAA